MSTLARETKPASTFIQSNPILRRLGKVTERSETNTATYAGIAAKTTYFLLITLAGMVVQLLVKNMLAAEPVWQTVIVQSRQDKAV